MGKGDNRKSPKMRRKSEQKKKKGRIETRKQVGKK